MKKFILIACVALLLFGCAHVVKYQLIEPVVQKDGFWEGTWHGIIMIPAFFCSLIWNDITIYSINNNGAWYNFGFIGGGFIILKIATYTIKGILTDKNS